jgi:hypothetical protein
MNKAILLVVLAICVFVTSRRVLRSRTLQNLPRDDTYCTSVADTLKKSIIRSCKSFKEFKLVFAKTASEKSTIEDSLERCLSEATQRWYDEKAYCRGDPNGPILQRDPVYCLRVSKDISIYELRDCSNYYSIEFYTTKKTPEQLQANVKNCESIASSRTALAQSKCLGTK